MQQKKCAVIVFHGMGQQVPFETLGTVADKLKDHGEWGDAAKGCTIAVENTPLIGEDKGEAWISRVKMTFQPVGGQGGGTVDFYEAYWAPITAGVATLFDAVWFLFSAGFSGIRYSLKKTYTRYFWKSWKEYPLPFLGDLASFLSILLLLMGLGAVGWRLADSISHSQWARPVEELSFLMRVLHILALPVLGALLVRDWKAMGWFPKSLLGLAIACGAMQAPVLFGWPWIGAWSWLKVKEPHALHMLRIAFGVSSFSLLLALLLHWADKSDSADPAEPAGSADPAPGGAVRPWRLGLTARIIWFQSLLAGVAMLSGGLFSAFFMWQNGKYRFAQLNGAVLVYVYGAAGVLAFLGLRQVLREFVGDLAAYLSAHKASRFNEVRSRIQKEAFKAAYHVYASGYDQVVLVGHSLGSVIGYDTLNGILSHDRIHGKGWRADKITKLFLTFGSPLDKTAFVFRSQNIESDIREVLAAAKQPLLEESHAYRPDRWVNVWSPNDVVSGPIDFYDQGAAKLVSAGPAGFRFEYAPQSGGRKPHANAHGMEPRFIGPTGAAATPGGKVSPVLSLIDHDADIPFAAHTQFWKNDLIYRILVHALMDGLFGKPLEAYLQIVAPASPSQAQNPPGPAAPATQVPPAQASAAPAAPAPGNGGRPPIPAGNGNGAAEEERASPEPPPGKQTA